MIAFGLNKRDTAMWVATYNADDCFGRDGRFDPGRIAEVLAKIDADLVAAQKVTLHRARDLIGCLEAPF